jgi:hypothetical protein
MMDGKCTIYFEDPFWVGVFERVDDSRYSVARFVFGSEPGDALLHQFALQQYAGLVFSTAQPASEAQPKEISFKRRLREARQQTGTHGVGTYAQRMLKAEQEQAKTTRQEESRAEREERDHQKLLAKQEQKKQKHRGR